MAREREQLGLGSPSDERPGRRRESRPEGSARARRIARETLAEAEAAVGIA